MSGRAAVVGGGPAGLMAAETMAERGVQVDVFDAMPTLGRKFLMAGKGGLNLTNAEPFDAFLTRFGSARPHLETALRRFPPDAVRNWAHRLGIETFVGTSGRVFPTDFKAAPLLRGWLRRLRASGVAIHVRHRWEDWAEDGALIFSTPSGTISFRADATVLALGGGSWPSLGSNAAWAPTLRARGIPVAPFRPANCGFDAPWSEAFRSRFAGTPVKTVALSFQGQTVAGEFVVTETGIEGGAVYALSSLLRAEIARHGSATLTVDLAPGRDSEGLARSLSTDRGKRSLSTHLRKSINVEGVKAALLRECLPEGTFHDPARLAAGIKALPVILTAARPLAEAISSAGGVEWSALNAGYMLRAVQGTFCTGEMLDWEAPTGGYLLSACFAMGRACGESAAGWAIAQS
ncbi:MAG TPA: TIGR03862 family flavoprotein [Alphaproteobacteria bacterium]|nr:TIGR03862 family flavoprotein [Alphaproteobacteria bacterium]